MCEYNPAVDDFDQAIAEAHQALGTVPGTVTVICRPTPAIRRGDQEATQRGLFEPAEVV